jgi:hypothetical protein
VTVTVSGVSTTGNYSFDVVATDGLGQTGDATVQWTVQGAPATPTPISPLPSATNVSLNPVLAWSGGIGGQIVLALDPALTDIVVDAESQGTSFSVTNLEPCTTYYWSVTAQGQCGNSAPSTVASFTTLDDLTFNVSPGTVSSCGSNNTSISLVIGDCFGSNGVILSATGLPAGATIDFAQNPFPAGSNATLGINLLNVAPGSYTVTVTGTDGVNNVTETFTLNITAPAAAPVFVAPANAATNVNVLTAFDWNAVTGATSYDFQLATDANFTNIVTDQTVTQTAYTLTSPLNVNTTYYWRVTAFNNCGGTTPAAWSFTTWPVNAVHELNDQNINISPNPTTGAVNVEFSKPILEDMDATLFSVNGILLRNQRMQMGSSSTKFDMSDLPSGVYLLRLRSGSGILTKKIVLEK